MRSQCYCKCPICGPEGKSVDYNTKRRHERCMNATKPIESTESPPVNVEDAIVKEIFKMTLREDTGQSNPDTEAPYSKTILASSATQPKETHGKALPESRAYQPTLSNTSNRVLEQLMNLEYKLTEIKQRNKPEVIFDTEKFFDHPLSHANPILVIAIFLILVLDVFGQLSRPWCNIALAFLKAMVKATWCSSGTGPTKREEYLLRNFPQDIRTVRKVFDMEPKTTTYAVCPKCFSLYKGQIQGNVMAYPARCNNKPTERSPLCQARLTTQHVQDGESIRVPLKPFVVQDLDAFVANLLSRPGIEKMLQSRKHWREVDELRDIQDGAAIKNIKGSDGKPFMRETSETSDSELRLVWSLCVDWFNPYQNKAAGKSASVGAIMMVCLNLPPHLRYKSENIFLVALIPGPREPSREQINPLLRPLVSKLLLSWSEGTWFTRTYECTRGRLVRSAIAASVNDLQAAKKVNGSAAWPAKYFCSFCLTECSNINDINCTSWKARDLAKLREAALAWKNARTQTQRKNIFREHGVRWSELMRLPYWDPTRHIVVDGMHNLFLGLVQFHCHTLLGISTPDGQKAPEFDSADKVALEAARSILSSNPTATKLQNLRIEVLRAWCEETGMSIPGGDKSKKADIISAILSRNSEENMEPTIQDVDDTLLPYYTEEEISDTSFRAAHLNQAEINRIREHIIDTTRPSWQVAPPSNLGESKHGKLKADQWRSCLEFDIPASLVKMWSSDGEEGRNVSITHKQMLQSTLLLATAIRWATSHRTSKLHAENYMRNMQAYLQSLLDIFPGITLHPNHHNALHIGSQLLYFGPMHGWWTFPFERIIGILQRYNTNSKIGELEKTMLESFCVASNIKAFVQRPSCPPIIQTVQPILEASWDKESRGTLMQDINSLDVDRSRVRTTARKDIDWKKCKPLEDDVLEAFISISDCMRFMLPRQVVPRNGFKHDRHKIRNLQYSTAHASKRDSTIFYKDPQSGNFVPGVIREIFSVQSPAEEEDQFEEHFFLVVHRFLPLPNHRFNPFDAYSDFGASLWLTDLEKCPVVVPDRHEVCHAIFRQWDENTIVMKPLNRDV